MTADSVEGLVLAGGGALGAYEVGVMEALFTGHWQGGRHGSVCPSVLTGTSVGAYNAAFLASQVTPGSTKSIRALRNLWVNRIASIPGRRRNGVFRLRADLLGISASDKGRFAPFVLFEQTLRDLVKLSLNTTQRALYFAWQKQPSLMSLAQFFDADDFISDAPLRRLIQTTIDPRQAVAPGRVLKIMATQWDRGHAVTFESHKDSDRSLIGFCQHKALLTENNLPRVIRASAAIPGILPAVRVGDGVFVDGGVTMNTPLLPAIEAGATTLHVIHLEPTLHPIPYGTPPSTLEALERTWSIVPGGMVEFSFRYARLVRSLIDTANSLQEERDNLIKGSGTHGANGTNSPGSGDGDTPINAFLERFAGRGLLTIHRHFPSRLVGGVTSTIDFRLDEIIELIELGFSDAVQHDCRRNGCIV